MKFSKAGFSLIELLVVIAIVAILAGVAIPTYRAYQIRGIISKTINVLQSLKDQQIKYFNTYGKFSDAQGLGLPNTGGFPDHTSGAALGVAEATSFYVNNWCTRNTTSKVGEVGAYFTSTSFGLPAGGLYFFYWIKSVNKTIVSNCYTNPNFANGIQYLPSNCQTTVIPDETSCNTGGVPDPS